MPSPYQIPTALPFDRLASAGNPYQATTPDQLGQLYAGQHAASTAMNQANYGNITSGYENILAAQKAAQDQAHSGYGTLLDNTLGDLSAAGTTQRQAIADQYASAGGDIQQQMLNSGLRGSTVQAGLQRGLLFDRTKADNDVMERVGNLKAGYRTNIGLQGLGFDAQAIRENTALGQNQLGMMERVNSPYPNAGAYDAVASRMGAAAQQDKDRQAMQQAAAAARAAGNQAGATTPIMPGGGEGFFRQPNPQGAGGSGYSGEPLNYGVPARPQFGPPPGTRLDARPDAFSLGGYSSAIGGMSGGQVDPYGASALGGVAGMAGLANQYNNPYAYEGEGGQNGLGALVGGAGAYGQFLPASSGGVGLGNHRTDFTDYGYGPGGGGDRNYGSQSTADFYFGDSDR